MDVKESIQVRRAYRSLEPTKITIDFIYDLATKAQLAPSCFNYQPWRFVFVHTQEMLEQMHLTLSRGNRWVQNASLIIAVYSKLDFDCHIGSREYFLFDTGMATAFLILRATELGLVAHPIAGYDEEKVKKILDLPEEVTVITLVIVGKKSATISSLLSEQQVESEAKRPPRKPLEDFIKLK